MPSCVVLRLTPTHKNIKHSMSLRRHGEKNETDSDLPAQDYMGAKTVQFYTSITAPQTGRDRKKLYRIQTRGAFRQPNIENHNTYLYSPSVHGATNLEGKKEQSQAYSVDRNGGRPCGSAKLFKPVVLKMV